MSIASISGTTPSPATDPLSPTSGTSGTSASGSSSSGTSTQISSVTQTVNADGTITVVTTYADGTTSQTVEPNPTPVSSQSPLSSSNSGQLNTLLSAQEQSQSGTGATPQNQARGQNTPS